jgi:hypothetical protein
MKPYFKSAEILSKLYVHRSLNKANYELNCIQRWYVLAEFMKAMNISSIFYGDSDTAVFVNVTKTLSFRSEHCDAIINVEAQKSNTHWGSAGEASYWTTKAVVDFTHFTTHIYSTHKSIIAGRKHVVDMTILWLWWVSHKSKVAVVGWDTGRPYHTQLLYHPLAKGNITRAREIADEAFIYTSKLNLPPVTRQLAVCNGLDVINRTVFDHMHAWDAGTNLSLNLDGDGVPYVIGASLNHGGKPESLDPEIVEKLEHSRLYLNNVHYQVS